MNVLTIYVLYWIVTSLRPTPIRISYVHLRNILSIRVKLSWSENGTDIENWTGTGHKILDSLNHFRVLHRKVANIKWLIYSTRHAVHFMFNWPSYFHKTLIAYACWPHTHIHTYTIYNVLLFFFTRGRTTFSESGGSSLQYVGCWVSVVCCLFCLEDRHLA